jgi:hypothetical protein
MSLPPLEIAPGPEEGAHRLTVAVATPTDRWPEAARWLAQDLVDAQRAAAWDPGACLELVGWSATPLAARFYLAGSALHWVAFTAQEMPVPLLDHLPLALGQPVQSMRLDRRPLAPPRYEQIVGRDWPFAIDGPTHARRVTIQAPGLGEGELRGLCELLMPALRREAWARDELPGEARPELEGQVIVLPEALRAGPVLEVVHVWSQVFWMDVEWVRWTT